MGQADELFDSGQMPEMMKHWYEIRKQYPESFLIAYRMGDFYEFFYDDAVNVSKLLGLTLTNRGQGPSRHPLAGIPHKATQHFKTLVKKGQTVVIVEQLEDPKKATGKIVKRGVVRILSPGTVIDDELLESKSSNFICAIYREKKNFGVAFIDVSSGDFYTGEFFGNNAPRMLWSYIARYNPVEAVISQELFADRAFISELNENHSMIVKEYSQFRFLFQNGYDILLKHFNVQNLAGFALEEKKLAICAAGGLLSFLLDSQKENLSNITKIRIIQEESIMFLDHLTQRNLELMCNQSDGGLYGSLLWVLDQTQTPMGSRLLKSWLVQPLLHPPEIEHRLDFVEFFLRNSEFRGNLRKVLGQLGDISRLITRINYSSTANARDLLHIKNGLLAIREIRRIISTIPDANLQDLLHQLDSCDQLINLIEKGIHESPPVTITEGGIIKAGYNAQVDDLRDILENGKDWVLKFEEQEKKRLGISTGLKVQFNRVLGYFVQITENAMKNIELPPDYRQRQTLTGGVRFETDTLKAMEAKILNADENIKDLEYQLFQEIRAECQKFTSVIQANADIIAFLDVLSTFAEVAQSANYCRPKIATHTRILIKQGRHPVIEQLSLKEPFVPNDTLMDCENEQILIITGPNWSGKSTYLRQVALITILAQIGCYVPASSAEIGIVDRIFTRIGASDDLTRGQSTFMMEMNETAQILNYASEKSLIIIDELGRGTGTADGEAIAQSVIEYLQKKGVKTLFSTHFHRLVQLNLPRIHNYHFKILEKPDSRKLIFLRQLVDGGTDKSYGIHVALMAGLPQETIDRAFVLLEERLCDSKPASPTDTSEHSILPRSVASSVNLPSSSKKDKKLVQTSLFPVKRYDDSELVIMLRQLDLDNLTPLQAFDTLKKLKEKVQQ
jgi:DNA mismatch repair protein MutS